MFATAAIRRLWSALLAAALFVYPHPSAAQLPAPGAKPPVLPARVLVNDAPPYRILGMANGAPVYSGIYIDILRLIAEEVGLQLEFNELPFARAFRVMEAGGADIMLGPNRNAEREAYLRYLEPPLPREPKIFLQLPGIAPVRGYDDLAGLSIAVLRGARYFDRFDADATLEKIAVDDYAAALRLVAAGRADAAVMPELQALWLLRNSGSVLQAAPYRLPGSDSYIVLARTSPLLSRANAMEAALRRLMANGGIRRILQRYE
jgi:polar amino acid transport system substrate-binding protein